jgi:hypothetical protein
MDRDVITDVFLCLGGSVKEEGAVGGFGQAKIIILFAHQEYEIYSKNSYVNGRVAITIFPRQSNTLKARK